MRAIDDDLQPVEAQAAREARFDELDIAAAGIVETLGAAELVRAARARARLWPICASIAASISSESL